MPIVYLATNKNNGKRYVGVTRKKLEERRYSHVWSAKSGARLVISAAIRKHGEEAFEFSVLETWNNYADALDAERRLIAQLRPEYNVAAGGRGPMGIKWTEQRHTHMRRALKATWTEERKAKQRAFMRARPISEETRKKMRDARPPDMFCVSVICLNDGLSFKSIKYAAEHYGIRQKSIGEQLSGRQNKAGKSLCFAYLEDIPDDDARLKRLAELKAKQDAWRQRMKSGTIRGRPVKCVNDGRIYISGAQAAKAYGLSPMTVSNQCRLGGVTNTDLRFMFADQAEPPRKRERTPEEIERQRQGVLAALARGLKTNSKPVLCVDDGRVFETITEAARAVGASVSSVSSAIYRNGKCAGLRFKFAEKT